MEWVNSEVKVVETRYRRREQCSHECSVTSRFTQQALTVRRHTILRIRGYDNANVAGNSRTIRNDIAIMACQSHRPRDNMFGTRTLLPCQVGSWQRGMGES